MGYHRKSADIDGLFEPLTDNDSEYNDDDEDDYVRRVWVLATLPEADRVQCVSRVHATYMMVCVFHRPN